MKSVIRIVLDLADIILEDGKKEAKSKQGQRVQKTFTKVQADVELLAVMEVSWGAEVLARVTDAGGVGNPKAQARVAAGLAYRQLKGLPDSDIHNDTHVTTLPAMDQENTWYTVIRVRAKKSG